jgi:hypothetical protein
LFIQGNAIRLWVEQTHKRAWEASKSLIFRKSRARIP